MIFLWMIKHYKATIALLGFLVTLVITPIGLSIFGFIVESKSSMASVKTHDEKIERIESVIYGVNVKYGLIQKSLDRIEEREYKELKEARQQRQVVK